MIDWDAVVIGPLMKVFGEPATYTPPGGTAFPITGIFDDAYLREMLLEDGSTGTNTVSAVLGVQLSQFSTPPAQNGSLMVNSTGATYLVREVRPDSRGGAKLMLSKVGPT
jgi:hypothetical protein